MALRVDLLGSINPFEWEHFACPICHKNKFVSLSHAGVFCEECNARFSVRDTAGDPGCVVDCDATGDNNCVIYAPKHQCRKCEGKAGLFDWQDKTCPLNLNHGDMELVPHIYTGWKTPEDMKHLYMVLKLGDYCSGWLRSGSMARRCERLGPTQEQWDAWQHELALL